MSKIKKILILLTIVGGHHVVAMEGKNDKGMSQEDSMKKRVALSDNVEKLEQLLSSDSLMYDAPIDRQGILDVLESMVIQLEELKETDFLEKILELIVDINDSNTINGSIKNQLRALKKNLNDRFSMLYSEKSNYEETLKEIEKQEKIRDYIRKKDEENAKNKKNIDDLKK
jgi:flagellar motor component MotA